MNLRLKLKDPTPGKKITERENMSDIYWGSTKVLSDGLMSLAKQNKWIYQSYPQGVPF